MKYQIQNAFGPTLKYGQDLFDSYDAEYQAALALISKGLMVEALA